MILITGAAGQVGSDLTKLLLQQADHEFVAADRAALDITLSGETKTYIERIRPEIIVHTAAITDVDWCEAHPQEALKVNGLGARNVAAAARLVGAKLLYVSTDYVFDGKKRGPYHEGDPPNPINAYGRSKLLGEELTQEACPDCFVLRTAWLYGKQGRNFVAKMLDLAESQEVISVVDDQCGTPTWSADLAMQILKLAGTDGCGIYHATSQGSCSRYEFAREIFRIRDLQVEVRAITSAESSRTAPRPANSVLENRRLRDAGLDIMPPWQETLAKFLMTSNREKVA